MSYERAGNPARCFVKEFYVGIHSKYYGRKCGRYSKKYKYPD